MHISAELGIPPVQYPTRKAQALLGVGRYGEAWQALQQEVADEAHPFGQAQQLLGIGCYEFELLAYDRAAATMRTAAHQGRSLNRGWMQRAALLFRTRALTRSGRLDDATFSEITTWLAALGDTLPAEVMAEVLFHRRAFADALTQAELGAARAAADGRLPDELSAKLVLFQTLLYLNRAADVIEPAGETIATAESLGHLPMVWRLRAARAAAHLRLGDSVSAAVDHAVAAAVLTTLAATIDHAELRTGFESDPDVAAVLAAARARGDRQ
jgi:hypothetical protein